MAITDWPEDERPRERLLRYGAEALSDAELLAIFLRVGIRGHSAVDLARDLLTHLDGGLAQLAQCSAHDLIRMRLPGLGPAKATQLAAVMALARRALSAHTLDRDVFSDPAAVRQWLQLKFAGARQEIFCALWLDNQNHLLACDDMAVGTLTHAQVYPREIIRRALEINAAAVIVAHNHPGGIATPSAADSELTRALQNALRSIDVRLLDHFIIAPDAPAYSFAEHGKL
jgi:DNA repair protein RadC